MIDDVFWVASTLDLAEKYQRSGFFGGVGRLNLCLTKNERIESMESEKAELIRKKYLYRRMILRRNVTLPRASAIAFVGPDCAYHLYAVEKGAERQAAEEKTDRPIDRAE